MVEKWKQNQYITLLFIIGAVFLFLKFIVPIISPILIGIFIVAICNKPLEFLNKKVHLKKQYGMILILFLFWVISAAILCFFIKYSYDYFDCSNVSITVLEQQFEDMIHKSCDTLSLYLGFDPIYLEGVIVDQMIILIHQAQTQFFPDLLYAWVAYLKQFASLGAFFLVLFISIVLLAKDFDVIQNKLKSMSELNIMFEVAKKIGVYINTFLRAQLIIIGVISTLSALALYFLQVPYGIFWGILAGMLDALPFIGTSIVFIPMIIWQLINGNLGIAIGIFVLYISCIIIRECLEPKLIGDKIGIYPIFILMSVYGGLGLFGISGLIKGPLGLVICYQVYNSFLVNKGKEKRI